MIIFDLDSLANDEHRRHFIEAPWDLCHDCYKIVTKLNPVYQKCHCGRDPYNWKENYESYYNACDKDEPVEFCKETFMSLLRNKNSMEIWGENSEKCREKIKDWFNYHFITLGIPYINSILKLRPIGDTRPQEVLFEGWLDATCKKGLQVEFVFSSHKPTIEMFRNRGIFVFDCGQDL